MPLGSAPGPVGWAMAREPMTEPTHTPAQLVSSLWHSSAAVLVLAASSFAAVFALRVTVGSENDAVSVLLVLPIALVAGRFGWRAGLGAAALGVGLVVLRSELVGPQLAALGFAARITAFVVLGGVLGYVAERARRAEDAERHLIASAPDAIVQVGQSGRIVLVNGAAERLFGYDGGELLDRPIESLVPERFRAAHERDRSRFMTRAALRPMGEGLLLHARRRDGPDFPVEISLSPHRSAAGLVVTATIRDVSERVRAESALRASEARYRALLEHAPDAIVVLDVAARRFAQVNEEAERLFGLSRERLLELGPVELSPARQPDGRGSSESALEKIDAAIAGQTPRFEWVHRAGDGREIPCEVRLVRLPDPDRILIRGSITDISERKRAERERTQAALERAAAERTRRLQGVTEAALAHLDLSELAPQLVARCRDTLAADTATLLLLGADGHTLTVAAAIGFADDELICQTTVTVGDGFAGRVAAVRAPIMVEDVDPREIVGTAMRAAGLRSLLGVPLLVGDSVLGVLHVGSGTTRLFKQDEVELLRLAGERVGLAIEHARLYERERTIAATLQRSLLPSRMPEIPGVALAASYKPAGAGIEIGGDFFDVFEAKPAGWLIVVGDVCGKGAEAAALTALARYTLRAEALHDSRPAGLLRRLNEAVLRQRTDGLFLTAVCALLTDSTDGRCLTVAGGGHPAPLVLRADGDVLELELTRCLIGVVDEPEFSETIVTLTSGDTIVLYTDGLLDAHAPARILNSVELRAALAAGPRHDADAIIASLLDSVGVAEGNCRDDIAVIAARFDGRPDPGAPAIAHMNTVQGAIASQSREVA